jgi:hypothetical protein
MGNWISKNCLRPWNNYKALNQFISVVTATCGATVAAAVGCFYCCHKASASSAGNSLNTKKNF